MTLDEATATLSAGYRATPACLAAYRLCRGVASNGRVSIATRERARAVMAASMGNDAPPPIGRRAAPDAYRIFAYEQGMQRLMRERIMQALPCTITSDQPQKFKAALALIENGTVCGIGGGAERVTRGPGQRTGELRERATVTVARWEDRI